MIFLWNIVCKTILSVYQASICVCVHCVYVFSAFRFLYIPVSLHISRFEPLLPYFSVSLYPFTSVSLDPYPCIYSLYSLSLGHVCVTVLSVHPVLSLCSPIIINLYPCSSIIMINFIPVLIVCISIRMVANMIHNLLWCEGCMFKLAYFWMWLLAK